MSPVGLNRFIEVASPYDIICWAAQPLNTLSIQGFRASHLMPYWLSHFNFLLHHLGSKQTRFGGE
ncbi:MAG: hypothetical protein H6R05_73 [Burkholderiaceae bacterium]|nr:hypothetical protein [Burkholderiaceae bacterium]